MRLSDYTYYSKIIWPVNCRKPVMALNDFSPGAKLVSKRGKVLRCCYWNSSLGPAVAEWNGRQKRKVTVTPSLCYRLQHFGWKIVDHRKEKEFDITRWQDGNHYYAKVKGMDVQVNGQVKWNTYAEAVAACKQFISTLV